MKFLWTVNDEIDKDTSNLTKISSTLEDNPLEDFIDEQCLHFEENFVNVEDFGAKFFESFDRKFTDESFCKSQTSTENVIICKKCGHDILRL